MKYDLLLISMPCAALNMPSLGLGILKAVLDREGISCDIRHFNLLAMKHFYDAPGEPRITPNDYHVITRRAREGFGDWIFAVPPFREPPPPTEDPLLDAAKKFYAAKDPDMGAKLLRMRDLAPSFLAQCVDEVLSAAPRVVGFTTMFSQNISSIALAMMLKARDPSIKIVFGGPNCEGAMGVGLLRAFVDIDVVVSGEAEQVLPGLARDLIEGRPIEKRPGLCFREGDEIVVVPMGGSGPVSMDDLPTPNYDEFFERLKTCSFRDAIALDMSLPLEGSRGCWWGEKHHCTFCGLNGDAMAFRKKTVGRLVNEIVEIATKHRILNFQAVDNIMAMSYFRDVLPTVRDLGLDLQIFYEIKSNLTREQVRLLSDAGVRTVQPGIESFSNAILQLMDKGVTALQNIRLLKWCAEDDVAVMWNVLYGFPGEPVEEYDRMADMMQSLTHLPPPSAVQVAIDRFSPYYDRPDDYGLEVIEPYDHYLQLYPVARPLISEIAYHFKHRHRDGRDPEVYTGRALAMIQQWRERWRPAHSLTCHRGPGFLRIVDRRFNLPNAVYNFPDVAGRIYLACDAGATADRVAATLREEGKDITPEEITVFLDGLVRKRLVYEEDGRYLSLATQKHPPIAASAHATDAQQTRKTRKPVADVGSGKADVLIPLRRIQTA